MNQKIFNHDGLNLRYYQLALLALLVSSFILSCAFYVGYYVSDDMEYFRGIQVLAGAVDGKLDSLGAVRLGVVLPAAAVYRLTDGSLFLTIFSFIFYAVALVFVTYRIAKPYLGIGAALLAAFFVAFMPVYYVYAGAVLPDTPLTFWISLALLFTCRSFRERPEGGTAKDSALYDLGIGLCLGCAYLVKETALIMFLPVGIAMILAANALINFTIIKRVSLVVLGFLAVFLFESTVLYLVNGTFSPRILITQGEASVSAYEMRISQQGLYPLERAKFLWKSMYPFFGSAFPALILAALIYPAIVLLLGGKHKKVRFVIYLFFIWPALYLTFGSTNFTRYLPPPIQHPRYYAVCVLPGCIIVADGFILLLHALFRRLPARGPILPRALYAVALMPFVLWSTESVSRFWNNAGVIYRSAEVKAFLAAFRDSVNSPDNLPVVLSSYTSRRMGPLIVESKLNRRFHHSVPEFDFQKIDGSFYFIVPSRESYYDPSRDALARMADEGAVELIKVEGNPYIAPANRWGEIQEYLYPLLMRLDPPKIRLARGRAFEVFRVHRIEKDATQDLEN